MHPHDGGELLLDGGPIQLASPRDALGRGIAAVYQDLALVPLMSVWRNFFLGAEPTKGFGPLRRFDVDTRPPDHPRRSSPRWASTSAIPTSRWASSPAASASRWPSPALSTSEPGCSSSTNRPRPWASSRPGWCCATSSQARDRGLAVIFITHNPHHAYPVGDRFLILNRGRSLGDFAKPEISRDELTRLMSGGAELEQLSHELELLRPAV